MRTASPKDLNTKAMALVQNNPSFSPDLFSRVLLCTGVLWMLVNLLSLTVLNTHIINLSSTDVTSIFYENSNVVLEWLYQIKKQHTMVKFRFSIGYDFFFVIHLCTFIWLAAALAHKPMHTHTHLQRKGNAVSHN